MSVNKLSWLLVSFVCILSFQNCSQGLIPASGGFSTVDFATNISLSLPGDPELAKKTQSIFATSCYSCHSTTAAGSFGDIGNLAGLVEKGLVIPGDPDNSNLMQSIDFGAMPPDGPAVSTSDAMIVRDWIISLAPPTTTTTTTTTTMTTLTTMPPTTTTTLPGASTTTTTTTTSTTMPGTVSCTITAMPSANNVIPGEAVNLQLTWTGFTQAPSSSVFDGLNYSLSGKTSLSIVVNPLISNTYTASVTGQKVANCQIVVTLKATASLTKDEFYRANIGPGNQSVNDLIEKRCFRCHNSAGDHANLTYTKGGKTATYYFFSSQHMKIVSGSWSANLNALKTTLNYAFVLEDITVPGKLDAMSVIHKPASSSGVTDFTTAERNHIKAYVNRP